MISLASLTVQTPTDYKLGINTISISAIKPLPQPQPWSSIDRLVLKVLAEKYLKTLEFDSEVLQSLDYKLRHSVAGDVAAGHERTMYYIDDYTAYKA
ncbi:hypothetical protein MY3296_007173 [Beauveria thailandica]